MAFHQLQTSTLWLSPIAALLVIRTSDGRIRWMNVTDYLKEHGKKKKQIVFQGQPFTAPDVVRKRAEILEN